MRTLSIIVFCGLFSLSLFGSNESQKPTVQQDDWVGTFNGICPKHNMKNEYGEDLLIFGNPVSIPSVSYTYEIYDNNTCSIYAKSDDGNYSCHNVKYSVSSNINNFVLTMNPETGSDCGGNEIILFKKDGQFSIAKGVIGRPEFKVEKIIKDIKSIEK